MLRGISLSATPEGGHGVGLRPLISGGIRNAQTPCATGVAGRCDKRRDTFITPPFSPAWFSTLFRHPGILKTHHRFVARKPLHVSLLSPRRCGVFTPPRKSSHRAHKGFTSTVSAPTRSRPSIPCPPEHFQRSPAARQWGGTGIAVRDKQPRKRRAGDRSAMRDAAGHRC